MKRYIPVLIILIAASIALVADSFSGGGSGSGGGGNSITVGACASLPSSGQTIGNLYKCSDFPLEYFFTSSSAAQGYFMGMPITTPPACASLTWVNQNALGNCTQTVNGPLVMSTTNTAVCCNNQLLVKASPATPYSFVTTFQQSSFVGSNGGSGFNVGLVIRDSSTGKFSACEVYSNFPNPTARFEHWTNPTTDSATIAQVAFYTTNPISIKFLDDGVNHTCYYSFDKLHWSQVAQEARTTWMATPNQAGFVQLLWGMASTDVSYATFYDYTQGTN